MKRDFSADHPELMDRPDISPAALQEQLRRLEQINRWFGGRAAVRAIAARFFRDLPRLRLVDLATGFADHPREIFAWISAQNEKTDLKIFAVDLHAETLRLARAATPKESPIFFVQADVTRLPFKDRAVDFSLCSLALHHFSETDAIAVLRESRRIVRRAALVIDLVRGRLAYAAVWLLTEIWMRDPFTRHDGRLSVRRAFTPDELRELSRRAGWIGAAWLRLPWFRQAISISIFDAAAER